MAEYFSVRDITFTPAIDSVTITVITDVPCHLWCRLSLEPPRIHKEGSLIRGLVLMDDVRFCFTQYEDNEQSEAGDTYVHTWVKPDWPVCTTKYMYFWGSIGGVVSPSESPIFQYHNQYVKLCPDGAIGDALLDTVEYDTRDGGFPAAVKVTDGIVALFNCSNPLVGTGTVRTYSVDTSGNIGALIDSWNFAPVYSPILRNVCEVSHGIFICEYLYSRNWLRAVTIAIADDGTITKAFIDSADLNISGILYCHRMIRHGLMPTFVLTMWGTNIGEIVTLHCDLDGDNITWVDSWQYNAVTQDATDIVHIDGTLFALTYESATSLTMLSTFTVATNGVITKAFIDTVTITPAISTYTQMLYMTVLISSNHLLLYAYRPVGGGSVKMGTRTVTPAGAISLEIDAQQQNAANTSQCRLSLLGTCPTASYFILWYMDTTLDAYVFTRSISPTGLIDAVNIDDLDLPPNAFRGYGDVFEIQPDIWLFQYIYTGVDGYFSTVQVT